jgi:hypothetical protein
MLYSQGTIIIIVSQLVGPLGLLSWHCRTAHHPGSARHTEREHSWSAHVRSSSWQTDGWLWRNHLSRIKRIPRKLILSAGRSSWPPAFLTHDSTTGFRACHSRCNARCYRSDQELPHVSDASLRESKLIMQIFAKEAYHRRRSPSSSLPCCRSTQLYGRPSWPVGIPRPRGRAWSITPQEEFLRFRGLQRQSTKGDVEA